MFFLPKTVDELVTEYHGQKTGVSSVIDIPKQTASSADFLLVLLERDKGFVFTEAQSLCHDGCPQCKDWCSIDKHMSTPFVDSGDFYLNSSSPWSGGCTG